MGKPDNAEVWERLDGVIDHVYRFQSGKGLKVSTTFIDSGGHYTQEVYAACRERLGKRVFAIKGKGGPDIPYVGVPTRVALRDNKRITCWLYTIGVDAGKSKIMSGLKVQEPGAKYSHFPRGDRGYDANYFSGLLPEKLTLTRTSRGDRWVWEKLSGHQRNEALDCRNYANAAFRALNPDLDTIERRLKGVPEQTVQSYKESVRRAVRTHKSRYLDGDDW